MNADKLSFQLDPQVADLGVQVETFVMTGVSNRKDDPRFTEYRNECISKLLGTLTKESIRESSILAGFRQVHTSIGVSNKKNVAAPEALLGILLQLGRLPQTNLLVDIYNLVSVQSQLSLGAHDIEKVAGNISLRMTNGSEHFVPLGTEEAKLVREGEYGYVDDANDMLCRLEVRQCDKTKLSIDSKECFFIVQGNPNTPYELVHSTVERLISLLQEYCGGTARILSNS